MKKVLLYGVNGWIGFQLSEMLQLNYEVIPSKCRLEDYSHLGQELDEVQPNYVLLSAGLTGRPNVDWCEDHKQEVLRVNVIGTAVLADECSKRRIHLTYLGTGCIFEYDGTHLYGDETTGFLESDKPNFDKSWYSYSKIMTEGILKEFSNTLILRIRMPLSDDLHPRNFITKITKYPKVVDVPNSMSVLADLLPLIPQMMRDEKTGVYNFTNPGVISHNQILSLYKKHIDPKFEWDNFSIDEQAKILKAGRSNNCLDTSKLEEEYSIPHIQESIEDLFLRMRRKLL